MLESEVNLGNEKLLNLEKLKLTQAINGSEAPESIKETALKKIFEIKKQDFTHELLDKIKQEFYEEISEYLLKKCQNLAQDEKNKFLNLLFEAKKDYKKLEDLLEKIAKPEQEIITEVQSEEREKFLKILEFASTFQ